MSIEEEGDSYDSKYGVEFRSMEDDAWHGVKLNLAVNILFITFVESEMHKKQQVYGPFDFKTIAEVEDFRLRFRPFCEPLSNDDCSDIDVGITVCVANDYGSSEEWRFYDGVVKSVNRVEHKAANTEDEECLCEFEIFWKHGPLGGTVTTTGLNNIQLLVQTTEIHPLLSAFLDIARRRFQIPRKSDNHEEDITLLEAQTASLHGDTITKKWKMSLGGISPEDGTKKSTHMPGLFESKPTISSSLPPFLSLGKEIGSIHNTNIEFRSMKDDAWHGVNLCMTSEGKLLLSYDDYTMPSVEESHEPDQFHTLGEIEDFRERFRPLSLHLSPNECHEIEVGKVVCCRYDFNGTEESRFYDAVVKEVIRYEHAVLDKVETCFCSFEIFWKHGPEGGTISTSNIDRICATLPTIETHPILAFFLEKARSELGRPRKHGRIDGQKPNLLLQPGFDVVDNGGRDIMLSRGEPSTTTRSDKGKRIMIN